jgi:hypothetical protein
MDGDTLSRIPPALFDSWTYVPDTETRFPDLLEVNDDGLVERRFCHSGWFNTRPYWMQDGCMHYAYMYTGRGWVKANHGYSASGTRTGAPEDAEMGGVVHDFPLRKLSDAERHGLLPPLCVWGRTTRYSTNYSLRVDAVW